MNLLRKHNGLSNTLWNDFFDTELFPTSTINQENSPSVNIKSLSDKFVIEFALPGIDKENIEIDLDDNLLIVSGESKQENVKEEEYTLREFSYQRFKRSFQLPDNVDSDAIKAKYKDGVLAVEAPKLNPTNNQKLKRIEIQ